MKNVALITGASSGLGVEFARLHAEKGGDLVLVARRQDRLRALADELSKKHRVEVDVIAVDLRDETVPQVIFDMLHGRGITLSALINNAGFGGRGKFVEREWDDDRAMIQVNVVALTALTRLFLPGFVARCSGRVLNVASTAALVPGPLQAVYYATKSYVRSFSNALFEELHDSPVTVTALMPGATETEFAKVSDMDKTSLFAKTASARSVAAAGYDAMLKGAMEVTAGVTTSQKIQMAMIPFVPRRMVLKQIREGQEV